MPVSSHYKTLLDSTVLAVTIAAVAAITWNGLGWLNVGADAEAAIDPVGMSTAVTGLPSRGSPSAPVVVVEFSDFECPYCAEFATDVHPELKSTFVDSGQVEWTFRHLPLVGIHRQALPAALAAVCAHRQGRFWEAHDVMFENQASLKGKGPILLVASVVPSPDAVAACANDERTRERVSLDLSEATRLGLKSTPVFLVGTRGTDGQVVIKTILRGAPPFKAFEGVLGSVLKGGSL